MTKNITDPAAFPLEFDRALNCGDMAAMLVLYDADASIRTSDNRVVSGIAAIRAEMELLITAKAHIHNTLRHIQCCGNTALIVVDWTLKLAGSDGQFIATEGTATNVLREDVDKGWRLHITNPQGVA